MMRWLMIALSATLTACSSAKWSGRGETTPELVFSCAAPVVRLQPADAWILCERLQRPGQSPSCIDLYAAHLDADEEALSARAEVFAGPPTLSAEFAQSVVGAVSAYQVQCHAR